MNGSNAHRRREERGGRQRRTRIHFALGETLACVCRDRNFGAFLLCLCTTVPLLQNKTKISNLLRKFHPSAQTARTPPGQPSRPPTASRSGSQKPKPKTQNLIPKAFPLRSQFYSPPPSTRAYIPNVVAHQDHRVRHEPLPLGLRHARVLVP